MPRKPKIPAPPEIPAEPTPAPRYVYRLSGRSGFVNLSLTVGPDWCSDKNFLGAASEDFKVDENTPAEEIFAEVERVAALPKFNGFPWAKNLDPIKAALGLL